MLIFSSGIIRSIKIPPAGSCTQQPTDYFNTLTLKCHPENHTGAQRFLEPVFTAGIYWAGEEFCTRSRRTFAGGLSPGKKI
ncbi:hypothetical protein FMM72_06045 [Anaerotruncus colihominis]|uniref:Uncharacterized protein n=1 Tax=Anaerotruncus colihominis TaxID=169435 RepID=A0A845SWN5_9FIRM|nr:hypothetical protein [Anaerotruncus colihominis]